jgi:sulfane dehydrogenase subunit SoxC
MGDRGRRGLAGRGRSVPINKALDDAMIALPERRTLMPAMAIDAPAPSGWEGNMNIKYLRRLKLADAPASFRGANLLAILPGGKAYQFYFLQEVKSFITHPSPGLKLSGPGLYTRSPASRIPGTAASRR